MTTQISAWEKHAGTDTALNAGNNAGKAPPYRLTNQLSMNVIYTLIVSSLFTVFFACQSRPVVKTESSSRESPPVILGVDNFFQNYLYLVDGKRVGLLTNPSGVNRDLLATSDLFQAHPAVTLTAFYGPEHGIRAAVFAGRTIADTLDEETGVPVYSLYGRNKKPSEAMLRNVDIIVVDIQDIGLRAYTFISTMAMVMQAAAETDKEIIILDRPNPLGGVRVEGNVLDQAFASFVGLYPIPYLHGMTIGELALLFNNEFDIGCRLKVVPMKGWKRSMNWGDVKLVWIPTSPHVPTWQTIFYMGATGTLGELGVLSTGVGYTTPFKLVGAPWINAKIFAAALNDCALPGVYFRPVFFKPYYLHYKGEICQGVQLHITDWQIFSPYITGLKIMEIYSSIYPDHPLFANSERIEMFDKVVGTDQIRKGLLDGISAEQQQNKWQPVLNKFLVTRKKYLIYQ